MLRTLIVATTSYAGMGPYVIGIVNNFTLEDDVFYFFHDFEDDYYKKNVKEDLRGRSVFYKHSNSPLNKIKWLILNRFPYDKLILQICRERSVKVVHYVNGFPSKKMVKKFSEIGVEVLGTVHDLHPHEQKKAFYKMWFRRMSWNRTLKGFEACANLVTNSKSQYEEVHRLYPQKRIAYHAFPSLVTSEIVNGKEVPSELINIDKPYILFFGRIEAYKGVELLCDAFLSCPELKDNFYLVIAGKGSFFIDSNKRKTNVIEMNRYIKDSEIAYIYRNAAAVVYPYISATQSGVLTLAFFFGTPVLASDVPFFKESIDCEAVGQLFRNGDVEDLKDKLMQLLCRNRSMIAAAQKRLFDVNYDGAAIRQKLLEIYNNDGWGVTDENNR